MKKTENQQAVKHPPAGDPPSHRDVLSWKIMMIPPLLPLLLVSVPLTPALAPEVGASGFQYTHTHTTQIINDPVGCDVRPKKY